MTNRAENLRKLQDSEAANLISRYCRACLRVTESLEPEAILQGIIDAASYLADARYGALITFDESGGIADMATFGMDEAECRSWAELYEGSGVIHFLDHSDGPVRVNDGATRSRDYKLPEDPPLFNTFLGSAIRHQGENFGSIYLTEKEGGGIFTDEDEEIFHLFAVHAGLVLWNACRHREERRARNDLEALLDISPAGVLVFEARTGALLSINEEIRRILGKLSVPSRDLSQLLDMMTLRTPDGRPIPLEELPTTRALRTGEMVLAEEIVIEMPDGSEVNTLVNARPVFGEDGQIETVVATIQDTAHLEELRRHRVEYFNSISHNLRTPLTSIQGSVASMLASPQPPDATQARQFLRIIDEQANQMGKLINDFVDMTQIEAGTLSVALAPTEAPALLWEAKEAFLRETKTVAITLEVAPDLPRVMADGPRIIQALVGLFRVLSGSLESSSSIRVNASREESHVAITVAAEAGVGPLFHPFSRRFGPSSRPTESEKTADDADLALYRGIVEAHGGRLSARGGARETAPHISFTLPIANEVEIEAAPAGTGLARRHPDAEEVRVLALDGDPEACRYVQSALLEGGFVPFVAGSPLELESLVESVDPHLLLVEPALPQAHGLELMEAIRRITDAPVIFVSGGGDGRDMDRAFELGAADYVVKPFTPTELAARIRVALRRSHASGRDAASKPLVLGDLVIDYAQREVAVAGRPVQLTATEYKLLCELAGAAGRVLTHEQLLRLVWGPLYVADTQVLQTYIKQLRGKLGDDARHPTYIFTQPRVGYRMASPRQLPEPSDSGGG